MQNQLQPAKSIASLLSQPPPQNTMYIPTIKQTKKKRVARITNSFPPTTTKERGGAPDSWSSDTPSQIQ